MLLSAANIDPIGNNTYLHTIDDDNDVEIGDGDSSAFEPAIDVRRFKRRSRFKLRLAESGGVHEQLSTDHIRWRKGIYECRFYRRDNPFNFVIGPYYSPRRAFEFDIILRAKPPTRRIRFQFGKRNVGLYEQPRLTLAQQRANGILQPINIGGSIAIYGDKKNNEFKTGKVGHLCAPVMFDTSGRRSVGRFQIVDDNEIDLIIPRWFYDNADWSRVLIDPTLGNDIQGGTDKLLNNTIAGSDFAISENGAGVTFHAWLRASASGVAIYAKLNIVEGAGGTTYLTNCETAEQQLTVNTYVDYSFNFPAEPYFVKDERYTLLAFGSWIDAKTDRHSYIAYDVGPDSISWEQAQAYNGWPTPPALVGPGTSLYSIYVDYDSRPVGEVDISFDERAPGIAASERGPGVASTSRKPGTTISERAPAIGATSRAPSINIT